MPVIRKGLPDDAKFDGALTTTFLLSMSTPIIVLPVERIYKPAPNKAVIADDSALSKGLSHEVKRVLDGKLKIGEAPFFRKGDWSFVSDRPLFNIAGAWPDELLNALGEEAAYRAATNASAKTMMLHIRNALAHGGIAYLDKDGRHGNGPAAMLGLVSAKMVDNKIVGLHAARISEEGFAAFVMGWAAWIAGAGVADALGKERDLAA